MAKSPFLVEMTVVASATDRRHGLLMAGGVAFPCALGRSGMTASKREGDGATPRGAYGLVAAWYRPDRMARPVTGLPLLSITRNDGWCDDPADRAYNRPVRLPFSASHEELWRDDGLYDVVIVIDYNFARPAPGAGSAIFLHLATSGFKPTAGCVAVSPAAMRHILARSGPDTILNIG